MNPYIGKTLGSYQILEQVGQGGMATIFKAYQPSMDRYVAVKILPSHFTEDETFVARFTQEARTLARLEHPHILPVHDYGEQEGITYLVMRYIDAGTLKDLITQRGPLDLKAAVRIFNQIGRALGYAHSQGVIHRDIKPTNVLLDQRGDAFLTDFGIAKLVAGTAQFTATGALVGTPAYMSPEQGLADPVDHRSDIYALGVVLYEMVTGRVPYEAETPLAVLLKHVNDPLPPPRQVKPDLPEAVERVILKAMAKSPDDRFQTAEEMVEALQNAMAGIPTEMALPRPLAEPADITEPARTISVPPLEPMPETAAATPPSKPLPLEPSLRTKPWLPIAGGVAVLAVALIAVLLILPNLGGGEAEATPTTSLALAKATAEPTIEAAAPPAAAEPVVSPTPPPVAAAQPSPVDEIVVDNNDPDFAIEAGDWGSCWDGDCGGVSYDDDFLYADPGCTSCRARFNFTVPAAGEYDVWTWWPQGDDRATDTPFTILYSGDPVTIKVDQRNDGSRWYKLGTFSFGPGESVSIVVEGADTGYANADAVTLSPAGAELLSPGWTSYSNGNFVRALARQNNYLWAGGEGGLVRWDLDDGEYVKFDIADGQTSNQVNDLLVDGEGNLWVATDDGLHRYDGEAWLTFDETDGLDTDEVLSLFVDDDGALWAGTAYGERGLNYYDGNGWGPPPIPPLPLDFPRPRAFAGNSEVGLFVGLDERGLAHFDGEEWEVFTSDDGLPGDQVLDLLLIDSEVLLISFGHEVVEVDLETDDWEAIPQLSNTEVDEFRLHQAQDGSLWFIGDGGAVRYDPETGDWQPFEPQPGKIPDQSMTCIVEDENGLWIGTDGGGVLFYDGTRWKTWTTNDVLGGNHVWAIRQDGVGALWFAHDDGNGLSRYDPADDSWQTFDSDDGAMDWPTAMEVDGEGLLWIGGYSALKWYDGRTWQTFEPDQLYDDTVFDIAFDPNGVRWLQTYSGVIRHDPSNDEWTTFTADDHPVLEDVNEVFVTSDGAVWAGGEAGLVYYGPEEGDAASWGDWKVFEAAGDAPERDVDKIAAAPDGSLWVVADGALYQLVEDQWRRFNWPDGGWIENMAIGPDGAIWVGHDGLARFDPPSGDWQFFTMGDGLINSNVLAIYVTPEGIVWVGTEGGISRYVPQ